MCSEGRAKRWGTNLRRRDAGRTAKRPKREARERDAERKRCRRAQCGEVWFSPYLDPAYSENIHQPMKKVLFTFLTLAAATSSVRPSRPRCAPRRRAPDALAQIPAPCSGVARPPPLRPRRAWAPRCLPGSLLQAAVACRRPRPPAFIPGSAPRRLPVSAPCLGASPSPR